MNKPWLSTKAISSKEAEITLDGYIATWQKSSEEFDRYLTEAESKYSAITLYINSFGGSVFQGININARVERSTSKITKVVEGVAASMAGVIAVGPTGYMVDGSLLMLHKPSGAVEGSAEQMRQGADALDKFEHMMVKAITAKTGLDEKAVKAKYFIEGKDVWLTADEAIEAGLIAGKITNRTALPLPVALVGNAVAAYEHFAASLHKANPPTNPNPVDRFMTQAEMAAALGLPADASIEAIKAKAASLKEAQAQLAEFQRKQAEDAKAAAKQLIDTAVASGKIVEAERSTFQGLAETNITAVQAMLEKIEAKQSIMNVLPKAGAPDAQLKGIAADRKDWTYTDWSKKDPAGLAKLRAEHPETFQAIFTKEYPEQD
jgi:ATP-dependent protease ClpP protease subunit